MAAAIKFGTLRRKVKSIKKIGIKTPEERRRMTRMDETMDFLAKHKINTRSQLGESLLGILSKNEHERVSAVNVLGTIRDARAVPALIQSLRKDASPDVRDRAVVALGIIGDASAVKPLIHALEKEKDLATGFRICWALGTIGSIEAIEPLLKHQYSKEPLIRDSAIKALEDIGRKHPGALKKIHD